MDIESRYIYIYVLYAPSLNPHVEDLLPSKFPPGIQTSTAADSWMSTQKYSSCEKNA